MGEKENHKAKLRWRCRRGMLELDLLLMKFFDNHFDELNDAQVTLFEQLLTQPDPDIYNWLIGQTQPDLEELNNIVQLIRTYFSD